MFKMNLFSPPKNNRVLLSGPWYQMKHMYYNTKCTILHIYTWECLPCGGCGVHARSIFSPAHYCGFWKISNVTFMMFTNLYFNSQVHSLRQITAFSYFSGSNWIDKLLWSVREEQPECWHQADYTLHTYWNHSFSHFVYILLADLAESSKDLLSQLLSHFYPLEIKQTNHNRESGWHFSLLFFISMAQEGRCQMSVHNYYQAL